MAASRCQYVVAWSGKGGVGKTKISAAVAWALARARKRVGICDMDILNPNLPEALRVPEQPLHFTETKILPYETGGQGGIQYMTLGCLGESDRANLFGGGLTSDIAKQLLDVVDWSNVDHLILDMAPGTGDLQKTVFERFTEKDACVLVTGPREEELKDAVRALDMMKEYKVRCVGAILNFAYVQTPDGTKWPVGATPSEVEKRLGTKLLLTVPFCLFPGQSVHDYIDSGVLIEAIKPKWSMFGW